MCSETYFSIVKLFIIRFGKRTNLSPTLEINQLNGKYCHKNNLILIKIM